MKTIISTIKNGLLSLFFPVECPSCNRYIKEFKYGYICPECFEGIKLIKAPSCSVCCKPLKTDKISICRDCRDSKKKFISVKAAGIYEGALRESIHFLKFNRKRALANTLGNFIIENAVIDNHDIIVPVPMSAESRKERGFNHTELIAALIGKKTGIAVLHAVNKIKDTEPQNKLDRKARLRNLKGAFKAVKDVSGKAVLVIDDVYTTGATMNEMATALLAAGAKEVRGLVVARSL